MRRALRLGNLAWVLIATPAFAEVCDHLADEHLWELPQVAAVVIPALLVLTLSRISRIGGVVALVLGFAWAAFIADYDMLAEGCLDAFMRPPMIVAGAVVASFLTGAVARFLRGMELTESQRNALKAAEAAFLNHTPEARGKSLPPQLRANEPQRFVVMLQWVNNVIPPDYCFYEVDRITGVAKRLIDDAAYRPAARR